MKNKVENSPNVDKDIKEFSPEHEKITPAEEPIIPKVKEEETAEGKKKKKRRNKKKAKQVKPQETLEIGETFNKYQLLSPNEFFSIIIDIANQRFKYSLNKVNASTAFHELSFMKTRMCKLSFLRDLCLSLGLTIAEKDYKFETDESNLVEYSFKPIDFISFNAIAKSVTSPFMLEFKNSLETAYRMLNEKNVTLAIQHTMAYLQLLTNMFGVFNTDTMDHASLLANLMNITGLKEDSEEMLKVI